MNCPDFVRAGKGGHHPEQSLTTYDNAGLFPFPCLPNNIPVFGRFVILTKAASSFSQKRIRHSRKSGFVIPAQAGIYLWVDGPQPTLGRRSYAGATFLRWGDVPALGGCVP